MRYLGVAFFIFLVSLSMSLLSQLGFMNIAMNPNVQWTGQVRGLETTLNQTANVGPGDLMIGWLINAFSIFFNTMWYSTIGLRDLLLMLNVPEPIANTFYVINLFCLAIIIVEFLRGMKLWW